MVQTACTLGNFTQLVKVPTRFQFNRVTGQTSISCLDHVYTNYKFRCSDVNVSSFGNSDHQLISYIRYSKDPPEPARTIKRRSYKNFVVTDFLKDLGQVDWLPVYLALDVDLAVSIFTGLFKEVLDLHAPWITYQQRKSYSP